MLQDGFDSIDQRTLTEGGRLSTVNLLVLTSLNQQLLILKNTIYDFRKTSYLIEEVNRTESSPLVSVPCIDLWRHDRISFGTFWYCVSRGWRIGAESENKMKMFLAGKAFQVCWFKVKASSQWNIGL